jgi:uroporphyrin-III C-methyltransferase
MNDHGTMPRVHLVGAGPGDPGLFTLRGAEVLRQADVVLHDRLVHPEVLRHARSGALLVYVGKEGGGEQVAQEETIAQLLAHARRGRRVVRLKGGDPFVFGRGGEEAMALARAGIPFGVVPGVSSGIAAPAAAGIPVTHRGLAAAVTFASASLARGGPDWAHLARSPTLVLFMVGHGLAVATRALLAAGRAAQTPAAVIESGTWEDQQVITGPLAELADRAGPRLRGGPALLVVGEVVGLRDAWVAATLAIPEERAS